MGKMGTRNDDSKKSDSQVEKKKVRPKRANKDNSGKGKSSRKELNSESEKKQSGNRSADGSTTEHAVVTKVDDTKVIETGGDDVVPKVVPMSVTGNITEDTTAAIEKVTLESNLTRHETDIPTNDVPVS